MSEHTATIHRDEYDVAVLYTYTCGPGLPYDDESPPDDDDGEIDVLSATREDTGAEVVLTDAEVDRLYEQHPSVDDVRDADRWYDRDEPRNYGDRDVEIPW